MVFLCSSPQSFLSIKLSPFKMTKFSPWKLKLEGLTNKNKNSL